MGSRANLGALYANDWALHTNMGNAATCLSPREGGGGDPADLESSESDISGARSPLDTETDTNQDFLLHITDEGTLGPVPVRKTRRGSIRKTIKSTVRKFGLSPRTRKAEPEGAQSLADSLATMSSQHLSESTG